MDVRAGKKKKKQGNKPGKQQRPAQHYKMGRPCELSNVQEDEGCPGPVRDHDADGGKVGIEQLIIVPAPGLIRNLPSIPRPEVSRPVHSLHVRLDDSCSMCIFGSCSASAEIFQTVSCYPE